MRSKVSGWLVGLVDGIGVIGVRVGFYKVDGCFAWLYVVDGVFWSFQSDSADGPDRRGGRKKGGKGGMDGDGWLDVMRCDMISCEGGRG